MNKLELIQSLRSKYYRVSPLVTPVTIYENNLKRYLVFVFDKDSDIIRQRELHFYVENEGEENEIAHWDNSEPKSTPSSIVGFIQEVNDYIQTKIDAGVIEGAFVDNIDSIKEIVYGIAIVDISGNLVEKKIFVDRDNQGNLQHRVIG